MPYLSVELPAAGAVHAFGCPGAWAQRAARIGEITGVLSVGVAFVSIAFSMGRGVGISPTLGMGGFEFACRIDALSGVMVMLTQPAVKTSLAWSTISQMGFMILQCGLALFPLTLPHIVAHSLYKSHAFLSSGNAVEYLASTRRPEPIAPPNAWVVALQGRLGVGGDQLRRPAANARVA